MMDNLLDYIEKYKFAIIGTLTVHILFFFYANFKTIEQPFRMPEPQVEMTVPLDDVEFDEEIIKQLELDKSKNEIPKEVYNVSADENDSREKSYENYSSQELDEMVESEAKELEKQYFEEWAATHDNGSEGRNSSADIETEKDQREDRNQNKIDQTSIKTGGSNAFAGEVMVSFNLPDRKAHALPRPGYTCNSSGTVVVDIKVDKSGSVKTADFNSSRSTGATECMINKAIRYAKQSRFNFNGSASGWQSGTITYKFISR